MTLKKKSEQKLFSLDLNVFLEGPYVGSNLMSTTLKTHLPKSQPFNVEPWYYQGEEMVEEIPNSEIVDWVLVLLYKDIDEDNPNILTSEHIVTRAAFLNSNGKIVDLDGTSYVTITTLPGNYYVKIQQRNHLSIISSSKIDLVE